MNRIFKHCDQAMRLRPNAAWRTPVFLLALLSPFVGSAEECHVQFLPDPAAPNTSILSAAAARTVIAPTVIHRSANSAGGMASGGGSAGPTAPPEPATDRNALIRQTISRRDLAAFLRALPTEHAARQLALAQSYALDAAFREGSLPIVKQILAWDPAAVSARKPESNAYALASVAEAWSSLKYFQANGTVVVNPPPDADYLELIRMLVAAHAEPNGNPSNWRPPLGVVAALPPSAASLSALQLLLKAGARVDAPHEGAQAPLVFAAESGNTEAVRLMLGAQHPEQQTLDAALVKTHVANSYALVSDLLQAGANINTDKTPGGDPRVLFTPMLDAVRGFKQTADRNPTLLMIKFRADPNRMSYSGRNESALMSVVPDIDFMTALLALGADPNYHDASGTTALISAVRAPEGSGVADAESVRLRSVRLLLDHGAAASAEDANGSSALKETRAADNALVALLLEHGATWQLSDKDLASYRAVGLPIGRASWAVLQHKDALAAAELTHGAPLSAQDCGLTYYAAASGAAVTLDTLIRRKGARADLRDNRGWSPLLAAAADGQVATLRLLLDSHLGDANEHAPVTMVSAAQMPATLVLGGSPMRGGETALMLAAGGNAEDTVEELIRRGAKIDAHDAVGLTALDYAERNLADKSTKVLLAHGAQGNPRAQSFQ